MRELATFIGRGVLGFVVAFLAFSLARALTDSAVGIGLLAPELRLPVSAGLVPLSVAVGYLAYRWLWRHERASGYPMDAGVEYTQDFGFLVLDEEAQTRGRRSPHRPSDASRSDTMNLFGRRDPDPAPTQTTDEQALARYRYMLATAPPEDIERAHEEAFARLTPEQRQQALRALAQHVPEGEIRGDDPASLARAATRAEIRQPGTIERAWGSGGAGFGLGSWFLTTLAASFIGTAIAQSFFDNDPGGDGDGQTADDGGQGADGGETADAGSIDQGDGGDFGGDAGGGDFGGGDFGGGDFGGGDFGGF